MKQIEYRMHKILQLDLDNLSGEALKAELVKLGAQG
jgi:hypothetical protein